MRFFIKAYAMHETEVARIAAEVQAGAIQSDDVHPGLIEGIAEADAIERLASEGIVVQAIAEVSDVEPVAADGPPVRPHRLPRGTSSQGPQYMLAELVSALSDRVVDTLAGAGAEIVERDPSGSIVFRVAAGSTALPGLPFLRNVRPYGARETLESSTRPLPDTLLDDGPGSIRPGRLTRSATAAVPRKGRYEAICHRDEDVEPVAAAIAGLGATVIGTALRIVRFVADERDLEVIAAIPGVASIASRTEAKLLMDHALSLIGFSAAPPGPLDFPFDGSGEIAGIADTGLDALHPDFAGRVDQVLALGRAGDASDPDGHGTHVAGTIAGDGSASKPNGAQGFGPLRGVAPGAHIYFQSVLDENGGLGGLPDDLQDLFGPAYAAGVRIHNNSWGAYLQSRYDTMALEVDAFVHAHPDFLAVIAAGNEGSCRPGFQSPAGFVDFPSLGAPATSKNGLTVGASRSTRNLGGFAAMLYGEAWPDDFPTAPIAGETVSGNGDGLAAFSSRGPCDDMRIKPDLVAPGTDIAATRSQDASLSHFWGAYPKNRSYAFMGGTSMACPIATGCALLVRQYYRAAEGHAEPSAALIKATLINGTQRLGASDSIADPQGDPNYHQGFGRIDLAHSVPTPADPRFTLHYADSWRAHPLLRFTRRTGRRRWRLNLDRAGPLRVTLAWTDPPGRALQNQFRLILDTQAGGSTRNWVGNQGASAPMRVAAHDPRDSAPGGPNVLTRDPHNNVQVIRIEATAGEYTLALFADGLLQLPQDFALVVTAPTGTEMELAEG